VGERQHTAAVTGVVVAGVLASFVMPGPYNWGSTLIGMILLIVLCGYADRPHPGREVRGLAAAVAFILLLIVGRFLDDWWNITHWRGGTTHASPSEGWESAVAWVVLFLLVWPIVATMSNRRERPERPAGAE
jgi:hypothetical protein